MTFEAWLRQWMARHPLKAPADDDRAVFTAQVMERVRSVAPAPMASFAKHATQLGWGWPWGSFALAAATAGALVAVIAGRASSPQGASTMSQHTEVLAEDVASTDDATWIEQMSNVLDQIDDGTATAPSDNNETDWQHDLEMLDDTEPATSS